MLSVNSNPLTSLVVMASLGVSLAASPALASVHAHLSLSHHAAPRPIRQCPIETKHAHGCIAMAPADWIIAPGPQGAGVKMLSPNREAFAAWYILPIHPSWEKWYGEAMGGDPASSMKANAEALLQPLGDKLFHYTSDPVTLGHFTMRHWESQNRRGLFFYHLYAVDGVSPYVEGQDYVESVYIAASLKSAGAGLENLAVKVAASIRGRARMRQVSSGAEITAAAPTAATTPAAPATTTVQPVLTFSRPETAAAPAAGTFLTTYAASWNSAAE